MKRPAFDFPEVKGKTIAELLVYDDPQNGREIFLRFADETMLSVEMETSTTITGKFWCRDRGTLELICERDERLNSTPQGGVPADSVS
jgi:hypothetical protein